MTPVTLTFEVCTKRRTFGPDTEPGRFRQVDGKLIVATLAAAAAFAPLLVFLFNAELKYCIIPGRHKLKLSVCALLKFCLPLCGTFCVVTPRRTNYTFYHIQLACHLS